MALSHANYFCSDDWQEDLGNPRGLIPGQSHEPGPEMTSHEACCILNASEKNAHVEITIFFEDREPVGPFRFEIGGRRTKHLRFNNFEDPEISRATRLIRA